MATVNINLTNVASDTRLINTTAPLSGGGDLTADRTITTSMATDKLIGRGTAGAGVMEEITLGTNLSLTGTTLNAAGGGGLTVTLKNADYNPAVAGDLVVYDTNGADRTVTLPVAPSANDIIGIVLQTNTLAYTVTVDRNGKTISGLASNVILYVVGDMITLQYDGVSDWVVIKSNIQKHVASLERSTVQSIVASTFTKILLNTVDFDNASLANTVNNRIDIRRTNVYDIHGEGRMDLSDGNYMITYVQLNGGDLIWGVNSAGLTTGHSNNVGRKVLLTAGDYLELYYWQNKVTQNTFTQINLKPYLQVEEIGYRA